MKDGNLKRHPVLHGLTVRAKLARDRAILSLAADGKTAAEIGRELQLSRHHVNNELLRMRKEKRVSNTTALVARALRAGEIA